MTDNIKIIQDMSLLYELSLSVGSSLDAHENCKTFLHTLMSRKNLSFASVWKHHEKGQEGYYKLFYMAPAFWANKRKLVYDHFILTELRKKPFLSVTSKDEAFENLVQENKVEKGSYAIFRLGEFGFLKLFAAGKVDGFPDIELEQLNNVVDKFAISLEGCIAHDQLKEETENRVLVQNALQRVNSRYADLFDNMYDALLLLDDDGNVKEANKAAKELLGIKADESPHLNFKKIIHPADKKKASGYYEDVRKKGFFKDFEGRIYTKSGQVRHIHLNSNAIYEDGKFVGQRDVVRDVTEQKRVERRVKESEATLRQVINYSLDAVVTIDGGGLITEWSKQSENMFGISRDEAIGQKLSEVIIPHKYREAHEKGMEHFHHTGEGPVLNTRIEITALRKSGEEFPIELSIAALENDDGHFFSGFIRDITERKKAEDALQNAQVRLTNLISNLQAGILLENEHRKVVLTNHHFCKIFQQNVKPDDLIGKDCEIGVSYAKKLFTDPELFESRINQLVVQRELVVGEILEMTNGKILERDFIPLHAGDKYLGHLWQYHDVTEKRKSQLAIEESEEKYRGIIENMELGLLEVDTNHSIVRPYRHFCEMLGYTEEELIGKNALELFVEDDYQEKMKEQDRLREEGKQSVYEVQLRRKDGTKMWALISGAPISDSDGNIVGSIGVHYDLTARKNLETDLAKAKHIAEHARLAERQFLANMSHEIRTPMNAVIGMTHLLYEANPTPTQKEYLDSLRFSADSLMGIINNVLDLSKIEAGELEFEEKSFNLEQLMKSLQRTFQFKVKDKAISVIMDFDPGIQNLVIGDPIRLNQILTNLLGNASKFTDRGTIGVRAKLVRSTKSKYLVEFRVHDTGIGIEKDKLEDIFQNFKQADVKVTRKYGGTGLGLTIVKQLVEMQGGSIRVESKINEGSTFIFNLSLKNSEVKTSEKKEKKNLAYTDTRAFIKNLNVLVVEDNAMNQKLISKILEIWGCSFEIAKNGRVAVEMSEKAIYNVILMDIHMPEMDGVEATLQIRKDKENKNHKTPIIALTAAALLEEKNRALDAGMNEFLTKPFSPSMLENVILQVMGVQETVVQEIDNSQLDDDGEAIEVTVDLEYLFEFSNGDKLFVIDMLEAFLGDLPDAMKVLKKALAAKEWELIQKTVHKLKPNFMMLGMNAQHEKTKLIETMIKQGEIEEEVIEEGVNWLLTCSELAIPILEEKKSKL